MSDRSYNPFSMSSSPARLAWDTGAGAGWCNCNASEPEPGLVTTTMARLHTVSVHSLRLSPPRHWLHVTVKRSSYRDSAAVLQWGRVCRLQSSDEDTRSCEVSEASGGQPGVRPRKLQHHWRPGLGWMLGLEPAVNTWPSSDFCHHHLTFKSRVRRENEIFL